MYHDIYEHISQYLTDVEIVRHLEPLEKEVGDLTRDRAKAKLLMLKPIGERFNYAIMMDYLDGVAEYYDDNNSMFRLRTCATYDSINTLKWLAKQNKERVDGRAEQLFKMALDSGSVNVAKYFVNYPNITHKDLWLVKTFLSSIRKHDLKMMQWIYSLGVINIEEVKEFLITKDSKILDWINNL